MSYNTFGQVTGLTFGSGDSDSFGYDSNTGRMTQYLYSIGATPQTVTGGLTWNANGTLRQLAITDQLNSANTQTCTYGYDDLVRVASVSCGSVWQQTFSFDPFGNISKPTGNVTFTPTYSTTTNRITSSPFTYDANGNTTHDNVRSYTWDVEGKALTADTISLTYDALGRMVEQSGTTQIVYAPTGQKFALMNGQTVSKAFVALPGGAQAVYLGTTLTYYRHADWLGSSRLTSTTSRTVYSSLAYAPFGETYAETGTPDRSFTGQNQDTVQGGTAGLYDFLYREYAQYGRWISPDPSGLAAVALSTPQSWNRYAYALNNPLRYVDLLGLNVYACRWDDGTVDDTPDDGGASQSECEAQGGTWENVIPTVETTVNVTATATGTVVTIITSGPDGTPLVLTDGGGTAANNGGTDVLGTLGQFFRGRPAGQSFNDCVNDNIRLLSGGTVDPKKLFSAGLGAAEGLAMTLSTLPGGTFTVGGKTGTISVGTRLLQLATGAAGLTGTTRVLVVTGGVAALRTGAVAGAATLGALIGSAANCGSPGVF